MVQEKANDIFINLNEFACRLDIQLGIEKRKLILAGNEKLTWGTDIRYWANWEAEVETRLRNLLDEQSARDLLHQLPTLTRNLKLASENDN